MPQLFLRYLIIISIAISYVPITLGAQELKALRLDTVTIYAHKPFREIGAIKTQIDSLVLRQSITQSLAEILSQSTSVFIKSYGRGTMSTASFRGTSPAHTQVLWNGMNINSPMLGQVDFSLIPAYLVDKMSLWHGTSASNITANTIGGAISIESQPSRQMGHQINLIQSLGSFHSYNGFLGYRYANTGVQTSTRAYIASSRNDFLYRNFSKVNILEDGSISWDYERSRNRSSDYRDIHILQDFYYDLKSLGNIAVSAWWMNSNRGVPMLTTDQRENYQNQIRQRQQTFRLSSLWKNNWGNVKHLVRFGYSYDHLLYTHLTSSATTSPLYATYASNYSRSYFGQIGAEYNPNNQFQIEGSLTSYYHQVDSWERINRLGYLGNRFETTAFLSFRYQYSKRLSLASNIREQYWGVWSIPSTALLAEYLLSAPYGITLKASWSNNYRFPTMNDLYSTPGGNKSLRPERSISSELGIATRLNDPTLSSYSLAFEAVSYQSSIRDWILWLPTFKGFWIPMNVRNVKTYGLELKVKSLLKWKSCTLWLDANYTQTYSLNFGEPLSQGDESIGKQLPYIPRRQSVLQTKLAYKSTTLSYRYNYYSQRFTTTANSMTEPYSSVPPYHMTDIDVEHLLKFHSLKLLIKFSVINLFNEEYVSVLHHPMPGRNYSLSLGVEL